MKFLEIIEKYILYIVTLLFPVFILTNNSAPAVLPKVELIIAAETIVIILWLIRIVQKKGFSFASGKFDLGVLLIATGYLLSTLFKTPNKMEAFLIPGTTSFIIAGVILYFLANQLTKKGKTTFEISFFVSAILLSITLIFAFLGLFAKIPQLPAAIRDPLFNPLGGTVPATIYLAPALFIGFSLILKDKDFIKRIFWGVSLSVIAVAMVILVANSLPGKTQFPKFPSFEVSWEVAVQTLAKSPVFGAGSANFLSAFNQYRPVSYNQTDLWQVRFTTATDFYLTLITETGILGIAALAILLIAVYKSVVSDPKSPEKLALAAFLIVLALFPISPVLLFPLFFLLSLNSGSEGNVKDTTFSPKFLSIVIPIFILGGVATADFFGAKIVLAEATFKKSLDALSKNDAKTTYDLMQKAVNQNPQVDRYHASLAQVDMALAQSLASKKDIKDTDKQTITQLVQQAINEGKTTVVLNPGRSGNWEILAQIYRSIMPFAQGADQFAIQTYTQAVTLDPTNPNLRIALGGVYYALGRYDDAIDAFKLAVLAKGDLANAHYNLAIAYREKKEYDNAISEINTVLTLVAKDSPDYKLAQTTLEELQSQKAQTKTGSTENLKAPQPAETSNIKPPITLPQEATPPATKQ